MNACPHVGKEPQVKGEAHYQNGWNVLRLSEERTKNQLVKWIFCCTMLKQNVFTFVQSIKIMTLNWPFFQSDEAMQYWPMGGLTPKEYAEQWYSKQAQRYQNKWEAQCIERKAVNWWDMQDY